MTRTGRRVILGSIAVVSAALLAVFLTLPGDAARPSDAVELGRWMNEHPADWRAASALSAAALDSDAPHRVQLWREAFAHAQQLAPHKPNAATAFVRGGLFHWYELGVEERRLVLDQAAPMLRDQATFTAMHRPLWELTRDFAYLRRNAPDNEKTRTWLRDLAVTHGLFDHYRELRDQLPRRKAGDDLPEAWTGTCGKNEICESAVKAIAGKTIDLRLQNAQSDEVPPYVEIYLGNTLAAEGPVPDERRFTITAPSAGVHRVEVRLANPWTRNRIQRRVRLS